MSKDIEPIQGILTILEESNFTATSKLGLLLALIELAPEVSDGTLGIDRISEKLIEIHWSHAEPYIGFSEEGILRQVNSTNENTTLIKVIMELKKYLSQNGDNSTAFESSVAKLPEKEWKKAITEVSKATKKNPLKLLQKVGGEELQFLYTCAGKVIIFNAEALMSIKVYGHVLREMIQYKFTNFILTKNSKLLGTVDKTNLDVQQFLFGDDRHMPPEIIRQRLVELQHGKCVYTGEKLTRDKNSLDHVLPWSRLRVSSIENFVITTITTNSRKSNALPGISMLSKWAAFELDNKDSIKKLALEYGWVTDFNRVVGNLINVYTVSMDFSSVANVKNGKVQTSTFSSGEKLNIVALLDSMVDAK